MSVRSFSDYLTVFASFHSSCTRISLFDLGLESNVKLLSLLYIFKMPFYAVAVGKIPGVFKTWAECQNQTKGYPQAKFRKFNTETEAINFVKTMGSQNKTIVENVTPYMVENIKPPELKAVGKYPTQALLKKDQISMVNEKVDNFIQQTNQKLIDFSKRLEMLESALMTRNSSDVKRKIDSSDESKEKSKKKKKHTNSRSSVTIEVLGVDVPESATVTSSKSQGGLNQSEVDGPWNGFNNSSPDDFIVGPDGYVVVYTDGACSNNGRSGAKAGLGVWFNHNNPFNLAAPVEGNATNNNAEIQAATRAIEQATLAGIKRLHIHTDSQFMINCITDWIKKWKKNNWLTSNGGAVKNKDQLIILDNAIQTMEHVKWTHIRGHMGNEGNECADSLARAGATMNI